MQTKELLRKRRHNRIRARVKGTAQKPRLVVTRSLMHISAQMIDDTSGKTICAASDIKVTKGKPMERAAEVGKTIAELALKTNIKTCVFDRAGHRYHGRVKAIAEAAREAGLKF